MPNLPALRYCEETIKLKTGIEASFLALGERLKRIKEEVLFEDQWSDFGAFLAEMKLSESTASRLIGIYETFVLKYQIAPAQIAQAGGWTVIADILPVVNSKKDAKYWLDQATTLTRTDLRRELMEIKKGRLMSECKHKNTFTLRVCVDCGLREKLLTKQN